MIILMRVKLLLLMLPKLNQRLKKTKQSYSGKRKTHDQSTVIIRQRKPKLLQQVRSEKTWLCFI
ncbi:hypothetical protein [Spiroplasma poulsonii]|uniref:hypothetical protein n=1 Tax=Spiroplasma poulsonii TaxID=2138 RepID=UPI001F4D279A|nr:hypothetical protein [Spiroplasma poulsonii]UNF62525.1 hypothetical protein MNU24_03455 [Spiroplasma poulsonii]